MGTTHPEWPVAQASHAGLDAVAMVSVASVYVSELSTMTAARQVIFSAGPLVRATVEHIAHAGWLLDPTIDPEQRVARRWMAQLAGICRYRAMSSAIKAPNARQKALRQARERAAKQLTDLFPGVDPAWDVRQQPTGPPWTVAGESYPSVGKMCRAFCAYAGMEIEGVYDLLSLVSHPNPVVLAAETERIVHEDHVEHVHRADLDEVVWLARVAAVFLFRAGVAVCCYFERDDTALQRWYDTFESTEAEARPST